MERLSDILGAEIQISNPPLSPHSSRLGSIITSPSDPNPQLSLEAKIASNMVRYFDSPWAMVDDGIIYTTDQADTLNPIKQFPNEPWLEAITHEWLLNDLLALYKSRRMTITWLMVFLHLWMAMFREGTAIYFVSDKEEKSDELVSRAKFMFDHIPNDQMLKPVMKASYCYLEFPNLNSFIQGIPQGADQLRQYTATALLFDEFAFWTKARETFMAAKPTIDGGGKVTTISSPNDGFFYDLCFDRIR